MYNIETKLDDELRITNIIFFIRFFSIPWMQFLYHYVGDPASGRREASVSPRLRLAAHEATGGGEGRGVFGGDLYAETMQVSDQDEKLRLDYQL